MEGFIRMSFKITLFYIVLPVLSSGQLAVRFDPNHIFPENGKIYTDRCTQFVGDQTVHTEQYSTFRLEVPETKVDLVTVTLLGENIACGYDLYVMPLTASQKLKWSGIWIVCPLLKTALIAGRNRCTFGCQCKGHCREIQVTRRPLSSEKNSWTLCYICLAYNTPGCSTHKKCVGFGATMPAMPSNSDIPRTFCDTETQDGAAWLLILRRMDGSVAFNRNWENYKNGFGNKTGEFWAGNEKLYNVTNGGQTYTLRVDLVSFDGEEGYALYNHFRVRAEGKKYRLYLAGYSTCSTLGDSMSLNNGMKFSTPGAENNEPSSTKCADNYGVGWWYNESKNCTSVLPTASFGSYPGISENNGIMWSNPWGSKKFAKFVTMMIRPN
ncbi:hypothetical protein LSH36_765g00005 [Paralvinella palmiformis]|uniref:Fibrinogen C-terminal domain-containing protein n=1 Tax=Paralvinella palmiformis TaxID=53620 RepID=A0AAD9MSP1_9ANNE|nr:hypothetical protein LSH36_765g00005 [Paralvinella palmiformis]